MTPIKIFVDSSAPVAPLTLPMLDDTLMSEAQQVIIIDASANASVNNIVVNTGGVSDVIKQIGIAPAALVTLATDSVISVFTASENRAWNTTIFE